MNPPDPLPDAPDAPSTGRATATGMPRKRASILVMLAAVAAGLAAGAAAWGIGETPAVVVRPVEAKVPFMGAGPLVPSTTPEAVLEAKRQRGARALGVLGGLTGLLLGLVGGLARGSGRKAATAGVVGLLGGGLVGAVVPWATLPGIETWRAASRAGAEASLLLHAVCWVPLGAAAGLALGWGERGRALRGMAGGALGAAAAAVVHEFLGAALFPLAGTGELTSTTPTSRLLGPLLVPALAAAGAALAIARRPATPAPSAPVPAA